MSADELEIFQASANSLAVRISGLVSSYGRTKTIDRAELQQVELETQKALRMARVSAIGTLAKTNIEEISRTQQLIESLHLQGPKLDYAMALLDQLSRTLQANLRNLAHDFERRGESTDAALSFAIEASSQGRGLAKTEVAIIPITIYLTDGAIHQEVEDAVDELLATANLDVEEKDEPVIGSWFRRMRAVARETTQLPVAREVALTAAHAADSRLILTQDAYVTATFLQNLGPVLQSLQPTKDAVLRIGALLIVKVDWVVQVFQLTAAQQTLLDHRPQLASSPQEIVAALQLLAPATD